MESLQVRFRTLFFRFYVFLSLPLDVSQVSARTRTIALLHEHFNAKLKNQNLNAYSWGILSVYGEPRVRGAFHDDAYWPKSQKHILSLPILLSEDISPLTMKRILWKHELNERRSCLEDIVLSEVLRLRFTWVEREHLYCTYVTLIRLVYIFQHGFSRFYCHLYISSLAFPLFDFACDARKLRECSSTKRGISSFSFATSLL